MDQKVTNNLQKKNFRLKNYKMVGKVTNNPSKFYFWFKKLQNWPKSDKQSIEILFLS